MIKVAINGFGRIGRLVFRIMEEDKDIEIVAINDLTNPEDLAYLLKYDTSHRKYIPNEITFDEDGIIVKGRKIKIYKEIDPNNLPWKDLNIDAVFECTGKFTSKEKAPYWCPKIFLKRTINKESNVWMREKDLIQSV